MHLIFKFGKNTATNVTKRAPAAMWKISDCLKLKFSELERKNGIYRCAIRPRNATMLTTYWKNRLRTIRKRGYSLL